MKEAVLAAERARAEAFVRRDPRALAGLLHDALTYIHATGLRHDRAALLDFVTTGPRFIAVELHAPSVELDGRRALVIGELRLALQRPGEPTPVHACSWASAWWVADGAAWRLRFFQSTRKEPPRD